MFVNDKLLVPRLQKDECIFRFAQSISIEIKVTKSHILLRLKTKAIIQYVIGNRSTESKAHIFFIFMRTHISHKSIFVILEKIQGDSKDEKWNLIDLFSMVEHVHRVSRHSK